MARRKGARNKNRAKGNVKMKKVNFIHTPKDWDELQNRIESLTGPGESTLATLFAGMAWNMAVDTSGRDTSGRPPKKLNGYVAI